MSRLIKLGRHESKMCATCEFWEGGTGFLTPKGYANAPETMELSDLARFTHAMCIKKRSKHSGTQSCSMYKLHYSLERYIY